MSLGLKGLMIVQYGGIERCSLWQVIRTKLKILGLRVNIVLHFV